MFYKFLCLVLSLLMVTAVQGVVLYDDEAEENTDEDERLLIIPAIQFNATSLLANNFLVPVLFGAVAVSVLSVAFSIGLGIILFSFLFKYKYNDNKHYGGTGYSTGYGTTEGYTSYRSYFDPSLIDWENFSVADMLHLGYETWSKYEPSNKSCQQRFICEVHRDTKLLGYTAEKIVDLFSMYTSWSYLPSVPEVVKDEIGDYRQAAEAGQFLGKDCGVFFPKCKFSLTKIIKELKSRHGDENQIENET